MSAKEKTLKLVRCMVPLDLLEPNEDNPNEMSEREFDLLVGNMEQTGWTDPAFVTPVDLSYFTDLEPDQFHAELWAQMREHGQKFRITGGHHRVKAGLYLGLEEGPCTISLDPEFDKAQQEIQLVRHNVIHGKMNPTKFFALYKRYEQDYGKEVMADVFGFADRGMLDKLIEQSLKSLPTADMKAKFKAAAEEIKTVDDLTKLLNKLFATHGDTLPWGYMVVDFGGKKSIWLRVNKQTFDAAEVVGQICVQQKRTMDDVFGKVLQLIANGSMQKLTEAGASEAVLEAVLDETPEVVIPEGFVAPPTKDNLAKIKGGQNAKAAEG